MNRDSQLTQNFTLNEFIRDEDPLPHPEVIHNLQRLAERLQVLRDLYGQPIHITSGYRTKEHHIEIYKDLSRQAGREIKPPMDSQHLLGKAADITIEQKSPRWVQMTLENWSGGLGHYSTFTHVDIRDYHARWGNK